MESRHRTIQILWVVQFLTTLAMNLGLTFVPFFLAEDPVLAIRDDATRTLYTCLILAGPFATTILFTPLWGWVADRTGPKRQVVRACFGLGITQLLMAVAQSADQMVVIRMLQGMVSGVLAACLGLATVVTPKGQQGRAIAFLQSATPVGQILGPVVGGLLAFGLGFRATYALLGGLILVTGFLSWCLLRQDGFVPTLSSNPFISLWQTARRTLRHSILRRALAILVGGQFAFTIAQGVFAIYAGKLITSWVDAGYLSPAWWNSGIGFTAIAMSLTSLAGILTSSWWGKLHDDHVPLLTPIGTAVLGASMFLLVLWPPWWMVLLARIGVGASIASTSTLQFAVLSEGVDHQERGQVMGLATSFTHLGNLLGFVLGGVLATWWSESGNFALAACTYGVILGVTLRYEWSKKTQSLPAIEAARC